MEDDDMWDLLIFWSPVILLWAGLFMFVDWFTDGQLLYGKPLVVVMLSCLVAMYIAHLS